MIKQTERLSLFGWREQGWGRGEARRPCFFCLAVHLTMNAFSPVGKEKEEVQVNTYQRCDPDLLTLLPGAFCWPSLCHMASARWTETWTCFSPMGQKTECQGDGLTEKEEKGTATLTCLWHRLRGMMSTRGHSFSWERAPVSPWTPEITKSW